MTDVSLDSLGPIDYLVVEFPAGATNFTGEMTEELVALVDGGLIRLVDVLILFKDDNGEVDAMELSDVDDLGPLAALEVELAELLAEEDVVNLAAAMDPGSTAGVPDLGELVGVSIRVGGASCGRSVDRQRSNSYPSNHCLDRG